MYRQTNSIQYDIDTFENNILNLELQLDFQRLLKYDMII